MTTTTWKERHTDALVTPYPGVESALVNILRALDHYDRYYSSRFGSAIANDYILGAAWLEIAKAARTLLNGELGRFDAGTLDKMILAHVEDAGFTEDEL